MKTLVQEFETKLKKLTDQDQKIPAMENKKKNNIAAPEEQPKRRIPEAIADRMLEFPLFDGTDSARWILKMELFFEYHAMVDFARMIDIIALCMSGEALDWFLFVESRNHLPKSWAEFRRALFQRFEGVDTMYERFMALQQDGSVRRYCSQFELYGALLPDIPDSILEAKFMTGLDAVIRAKVRVFLPKGIEDMMETARLVEDKILAGGETLRNTMKLRATVDGKPVVVKVDSGATHNFICRNLAEELTLPVQAGVLLRIQHLIFVVDCLPIEMEGDFEVIMGMPWLRGMEVDWKALTIKLNSGEKTVTFQGDPCL